MRGRQPAEQRHDRQVWLLHHLIRGAEAGCAFADGAVVGVESSEERSLVPVSNEGVIVRNEAVRNAINRHALLASSCIHVLLDHSSHECGVDGSWSETELLAPPLGGIGLVVVEWQRRLGLERRNISDFKKQRGLQRHKARTFTSVSQSLIR